MGRNIPKWRTPEFVWKATEYVAEVTANAPCPFCKNASWAYTLDKEDGAPRRGLIQYTDRELFSALPTLALTCDKCGYVRHHDLAMISTKLGDEIQE